jgi:lsr operon transcriptional repressor
MTGRPEQARMPGIEAIVVSIVRPGTASTDQDRQAILVRAAWLYYKDRLTQAEIAEQLFVSRATVGRLLDAARDEGIVRFEISADHLAALKLSGRLRERHGLADAIVVPRASNAEAADRTNERVAAAGAEYVKRFLKPGAVIGVGWGDTVTRVLLALPRSSLEGVTIATVAGGINAYTRQISALSTNGVNEHLRVIPAPLIASSATIAAALRQDASVTSVLRLAEGAVATLTGIGSSLSVASSVRSGLFSQEQVDEFRAMGAVGDMLGEWFDATGVSLVGAASDRKIGMGIEQLRQMPNVVGVAGGRDKVEAIAGVLRGGYLDVLVTDEDVAELLLDGP